ncbi:hypothetical protein OIE50_02395 [Streptomyces canus]|uniref:hypothetical protein n=1 Tax=Streptomyces canus TaxID=58343 RepID=UPI00324805AA
MNSTTAAPVPVPAGRTAACWAVAFRLPAEQVAAEPPGAGADDGSAEAAGEEEPGAEDAGREAEDVEGPEAELPGFGVPGVEEAAELTAPDGVTSPSAVSAPPPPG